MARYRLADPHAVFTSIRTRWSPETHLREASEKAEVLNQITFLSTKPRREAHQTVR